MNQPLHLTYNYEGNSAAQFDEQIKNPLKLSCTSSLKANEAGSGSKNAINLKLNLDPVVDKQKRSQTLKSKKNDNQFPEKMLSTRGHSPQSEQKDTKINLYREVIKEFRMSHLREIQKKIEAVILKNILQESILIGPIKIETWETEAPVIEFQDF